MNKVIKEKQKLMPEEISMIIISSLTMLFAVLVVIYAFTQYW